MERWRERERERERERATNTFLFKFLLVLLLLLVNRSLSKLTTNETYNKHFYLYIAECYSSNFEMLVLDKIYHHFGELGCYKTVVCV